MMLKLLEHALTALIFAAGLAAIWFLLQFVDAVMAPLPV